MLMKEIEEDIKWKDIDFELAELMLNGHITE